MKSNTIKLFESIQNNLREGVEEDNFIKQCEESGKFNGEQIKKIVYGFEDGLSIEQVQVYAKPEFNSDQMKQIRTGFEDGLSMEQVQVYAKPEFSDDQMEEIKFGFEAGLSIEQVQVYAKPEFNHYQMYKIRECFEAGLDLSMEQIQFFLNPKFNHYQIDMIAYGFENGLSMEQVQVYAKPEFDEYQMYEIKEGFENGLSMEQVQQYAKPEFDNDQMRRIRYVLQYNLQMSIEQALNMSDGEFNDIIDKAKYPGKYDSSKAYYIMEDGYLQGVTKDEKYYSDDWNTWSCYDAETISEAKAFKKYSTAENFLDKRIDNYSGEERISGLSSDTVIISLNQLLSGEVKTKTDISAILNKSSKKSTKNKEVNKSVDNEPVDDNEDIDDTMTYTMTASDGTKFSYQEEYADPESRSDYEDHDEFWQAIKYCDEHGLDELTAWEGDREFVWRKDEEGHWKNETTDEYIN